jgi:hypothetical protein
LILKDDARFFNNPANNDCTLQNWGYELS